MATVDSTVVVIEIVAGVIVDRAVTDGDVSAADNRVGGMLLGSAKGEKGCDTGVTDDVAGCPQATSTIVEVNNTKRKM